jgi:hypothetical protein
MDIPLHDAFDSKTELAILSSRFWSLRAAFGGQNVAHENRQRRRSMVVKLTSAG